MRIAVVGKEKLGLPVVSMFEFWNTVPKALQSLSGLVYILRRPEQELPLTRACAAVRSPYSFFEYTSLAYPGQLAEITMRQPNALPYSREGAPHRGVSPRSGERTLLPTLYY